MNQQHNPSQDPSQDVGPAPPQQPGAPAVEPRPGPGYQGREPQWRRDPFNPFDPRRKSPVMASMMSLIPGLGQIYIGNYQQGFVNAAVIIGVISTLAGARLPEFMYPLLGLFLPFFWLYNIVDAGRRAAFYNQRLEGAGAEELQDFTAPGRGSMVGGISLILIGGLLLLHTRFDFSLEWLAYWWPLAPILIGVYLVVQASRERNRPA